MKKDSIVVDGVCFENPVIIASCPLTESKSNIMKCAEAGAGGVILKTAAAYQRGTECGQRKILRGKNGYWAQSAFAREILTIEEAAELITETRDCINIPIIASIAADSLSCDNWVYACTQMEKAGADMLQLDFFYMPDLVALAEAKVQLSYLLVQLKKTVHIPIVPKININLPADFIFPVLKKSGISTVSLLDSIRVPLVREWVESQYWEECTLTNEGTSFFGGWQLPLSLHFLMEARIHGLKVIGGGGIRSVEDAEIMLNSGADLIQIASMAMFGRWEEINKLKERLGYKNTY